jgi:hypothetical protein
MRRERALTGRAYDNVIYGGLRNDFGALALSL